ncbi:MAG: hypothetical protein WC429_09510 [Verrucomicrobiia bacterium]
MNAAHQLHNAARKYCIDRYAHWCAEYQKLSERGRARIGSGYSDEAYDIFPRYNVLSAILTEIERIDSDDLPDYSALSDLLILAGHTASSPFTEKPHSNIEAAAIADERLKFAAAVQGFTLDSLAKIPMLPYRRVLSSKEVVPLWEQAKQRWAADGSYFYPLAERTDASLWAFDAAAFHREFPPKRLQDILRSWGIKRLYELREYGANNYLLSTDAWDPAYDGAEGFWFTSSFDWIMYASHEGSITTGGTLTDVILSEWKASYQHQWTLGTNG